VCPSLVYTIKNKEKLTIFMLVTVPVFILSVNLKNYLSVPAM
jgi:hypothetical protein